MSTEESRKEARNIIKQKNEKIRVQGIKHFNMSSPLPEMEEELNRVVHEKK